MQESKQGLVTEFLESEQSSGIVLILATIVSIGLANSPLGLDYLAFWQQKIGVAGAGIALKMSVEHWINDGLMAVFFCSLVWRSSASSISASWPTGRRPLCPDLPPWAV